MTEYFTPPTLLDDVLDELREAREMVAYLTRANEALTGQIDGLADEVTSLTTWLRFWKAMAQRPEHRLVSAAREALAMAKSGGESHD